LGSHRKSQTMRLRSERPDRQKGKQTKGGQKKTPRTGIWWGGDPMPRLPKEVEGESKSDPKKELKSNQT